MITPESLCIAADAKDLAQREGALYCPSSRSRTCSLVVLTYLANSTELATMSPSFDRKMQINYIWTGNVILYGGLNNHRDHPVCGHMDTL